MSDISRQAYADMFSPTTGDKVRLADTDLWIRAEQDFTAYSEKAEFGGGKVIRDDMSQGQMCADARMDLVITNALIVDHWGVVKADIGIKNDRIFAIGKVGNPDIQPNVTIPIGVGTGAIAGEGKIVTTSGVDMHVHWICPQQAQEALVSGVTTMIGGGTGPAAGTHATTCVPGPWYIACMLQAVGTLLVNIGLLGKGNGSDPDALREQISAGTIGLKIHENWGATPTAIDCVLTVANEMDIQIALHSGMLNESGFAGDTPAAIGDCTIHTFHIEGADGGRAPDIITACAHPNILPPSMNPTLSYTVNTIDEHLDMLMVCHHLDPDIVEDVVFAESRVRRETIAAEDVPHDISVFSLTPSDSQTMGRAGEVTLRIWQVAYHTKAQCGPLAEEIGDNDNLRAKRYVAKYTINPALTHGIVHEVGSVESGKLADLVLWLPAFFGAKPATVAKGGMVAYAPMGDANASIPIPQLVYYRMMFDALGAARHYTRLTFISQAADARNIPQQLNLQSAIAVVKGYRTVKKVDTIHNGLQPNTTVDVQTYEVRIDGELIASEPADVLPMA